MLLNLQRVDPAVHASTRSWRGRGTQGCPDRWRRLRRGAADAWQGPQWRSGSVRAAEVEAQGRA
jgi:hypothetical protein